MMYKIMFHVTKINEMLVLLYSYAWYWLVTCEGSMRYPVPSGITSEKLVHLLVEMHLIMGHMFKNYFTHNRLLNHSFAAAFKL